MTNEPKLYAELASWFHLLTDPADYAEEAELYRSLLVEACDPRAVHDRHVCEVFERSTWLGLLEELGFEAEARVTPWESELFIARRLPA